jgi:hypothetical protein
MDTLRGYVRDAEIFKDHAGKGLLQARAAVAIPCQNPWEAKWIVPKGREI